MAPAPAPCRAYPPGGHDATRKSSVRDRPRTTYDARLPNRQPSAQAAIRRVVRHRRVAIAFAFAIAVHVAVLFLSPAPPKPLPGAGQGDRPPGPDIVARLAPAAPQAPAARPTLPDPAEAVRPPRPRPAPARPRPVPPAAPLPPMAPLAPLPQPEPPPRLVVPGPGPMPLPAPLPPSRPPAADLSELIAQRRRERGEPPAPPTREDDERARAERAIASNLATITQPPVGTSPRESGGVFQITEMTARRAEFTFFGWHRESRRRATQRVDVRLGDAPDIQTAIARRMIEIIREHEQGDFTWRSTRLGRDLVLSARLEDAGALEHFLKEEFFEPRR